MSGINASLNLNQLLPSSSSTYQYGTTKKVLSQEAIDNLVNSVLGADNGLASLAGGENLAGGFGSSTKAQLAQDMITNLVGQLANVTAETVTTEDQSTESDGQLADTVKGAFGTIKDVGKSFASMATLGLF